MTDTSVASDLLKSLDVHSDLSSEVTLYQCSASSITSLIFPNFFICQVSDTSIRIYIRCCENLVWHLFCRFRRYKSDRSLHVFLLVSLHQQFEPCNCSSIFLLSLTGAIFTAQPQHTCGLSNPLSHEPLKASLRGIQLLRTAVSHRIVDCQNPGSVLKAISQRNKILTIYIKRIVFSFIPSLY